MPGASSTECVPDQFNMLVESSSSLASSAASARALLLVAPSADVRAMVAASASTADHD